MPVISIGYYSNSNIGDDQYLISIPKAFPKEEFYFTPEIGQAHLDYKTAMLGGGNIAFPSYTKKIQSFPSKYAISISLNEKSDFVELESYKQIIVRDFASLAMLEKHGIKGTYAPDFSIMLQPNRENGERLLERIFHGITRYEKVVCVIVNAHLLYSDDHSRPLRDELRFQRFATELADVMDNVEASFVFLPFSTNHHFDDRISNGWVSHYCKWFQKNVRVNENLGVQNTLDLISACNATISTRLHGLIFSFIAGVPFLDITHDSKTINFIKTIDKCGAIPYNTFERKECKTGLEAMFDLGQVYSTLLKRRVEEERQILGQVIQSVDFR
jgi:polysaccharide pyruvyl transferase WcaK-like protein